MEKQMSQAQSKQEQTLLGDGGGAHQKHYVYENKKKIYLKHMIIGSSNSALNVEEEEEKSVKV